MSKQSDAEILFALGQVHALLDGISERLERRECSVREYVEVSGLCENTVYKRLADGTIPARRIGRTWRVKVPS